MLIMSTINIIYNETEILAIVTSFFVFVKTGVLKNICERFKMFTINRPVATGGRGWGGCSPHNNLSMTNLFKACISKKYF